MPYSPVWLCKYRRSSNQRYHFALFVPNADYVSQDLNDKSRPCKGTIIHVTGAPMAGYVHEFKRNYDTSSSLQLKRSVQIGSVDQSLVHQPADESYSKDDTGLGQLDRIALEIQPPRKSENFMAPINDTTNRRCQEWTMDYIRALVRNKYLHENAVGLAQAERDPPNHGVGLRSVGSAGGRAQGNQPAGNIGKAVASTQAAQQAPQWIWDAAHGKHRYWNQSKNDWVWQDAEAGQSASQSQPAQTTQAGQSSAY